MDRLAVISNDVIITGDLNFHHDNVNDADAVHFNGTLEVHELVQHVVGLTHKKGDTFYVIITRDISSLLIGMPTVSEPRLGNTKGNPSGDHLAVCSRINLTKPDSVRQPDELRHAKHARRRAEKVWRRTKLTVHRKLFRKQCNAVNKLMISTKKTFFSAKIRDCSKDQKQLFKLTSHLMGNTGQVILPIHESAEQLANMYGYFYIDKVTTIRRSINIGNPSDIYETALDSDVKFDGIPLQRFLPATHDEVKRIITNSPNKSCDLDPIPTRLLRQCLDHFVPLITFIIN